MPIRTRSGLVIALLTGQPGAETWDEAMKKLTSTVGSASLKMMFSKDQSDHRQGKYPTVATGLSYSGGAVVSFSLHSQRTGS